MLSPSSAPRAVLLVLLRHGDAGEALADPRLDAKRPLSPKGHKQSRRAGRVLDRLGLRPDEVWTSSLVRAIETADGAVAALAARGPAVRRVRSATLDPDAAPERLARALADSTNSNPPTEGGADTGRRRASRRTTRARAKDPTPTLRWLVGHQPHLARFAGYLTGTPAAAIDLAKGAIVVLDLSDAGPVAGSARIRMLLPPDAVKALRP